MNALDLYEHCTQSPTDMARILDAIHGGQPRRLCEDFSGTAATARAWITLAPDRSATAIDLDPHALNHRPTRGVRTLLRDVQSAPLTPKHDIIFVGNFSIGELHDPDELSNYISRCAKRLSSSGVLVIELYDGPSAWKTGTQQRTIKLPRSTTVTYTWRQVEAKKSTRRVVNEIDFIVKTPKRSRRFDRAFRYDWRLWSHLTLSRIMRESGFKHTALFPPRIDALDSLGHAYIQPMTRTELGDDAVFLLAGFKN